jgi:hypothetical protein
MTQKQHLKNKSLAAHPGGATNGQGGAQQGTRARGEQYLEGSSRSHTLSAPDLFDPTLNHLNSNPENHITNYPCPVSVFSKQAHWIQYSKSEKK